MEAIEKAVEIAEERNKRRDARNPQVRKALDVVYDFMKDERVICYGGTAINALLPKRDQFYDPETTLPDYDVFTETPQMDAMILADRLAEAGLADVEVRPGVHLGTFKIFANYTGVADFTYLDSDVFDTLWKSSIEKDGVHYANPNFLRMAMYLELSRPRGDVSRWSKVYERLQLLNDAYPIDCKRADGEGDVLEDPAELEDFLVDHEVVVLGLHASQVHQRKLRAWDLPIDLLVRPDDADDVLEKLKPILGDVRTERHDSVEEFLPPHTDLLKGKRLIARVFETQACHSYHKTSDGIKIASIPTILQFFMAFLYADKHTRQELNTDRLMCIAQRLIDLAQGDRHKRRFAFLTPLDCLGDQSTLPDVRTQKAKLYKEVSKDRSSPDFLKYFFTYNPSQTTPQQKKTLKAALKRAYRNKRTSRN